jgi:hypothetical protein
MQNLNIAIIRANRAIKKSYNYKFLRICGFSFDPCNGTPNEQVMRFISNNQMEA